MWLVFERYFGELNSINGGSSNYRQAFYRLKDATKYLNKVINYGEKWANAAPYRSPGTWYLRKINTIFEDEMPKKKRKIK